MIKAETITHEGSPGPNWLERCRDVFTPQINAAIVVFLAAAILAIVYSHHKSAVVQQLQSPATASQQTGLTDSPSDSLQVLAPTATSASTGTTDSSETANLQAANNAGDSAVGAPIDTTPSELPGAAASSNNLVGPAPTSSSQGLQSVSSGLEQGTGQTLNNALYLVP